MKALLEAYCAASLAASAPASRPALPDELQIALLDVTDDLDHLRALITALDMAFADLHDRELKPCPEHPGRHHPHPPARDPRRRRAHPPASPPRRLTPRSPSPLPRGEGPGVSDCLSRQASCICHGVLSRMIALRMVRSFLAVARVRPFWACPVRRACRGRP